MNTLLRNYEPCPAIKPFVESYWYGSFNTDSDGLLSLQMIPSGNLELIIHLTDLHCDLLYDDGWSQSPDYTIMGLFTKPYVVKFSQNVRVFGVRFKPEGILSVFGVPSAEFRDCFEDITSVLGRDFRDFCHRLREERHMNGRVRQTDDYLLGNLERSTAGIPYLNRAAQLIRQGGALKIEDLAGKVYISKRQLERQFKAKLGISPKHYFRIARINEALRLIAAGQSSDLTTIAYQCGYFDQSHFIRDFRKITGSAPGELLRGATGSRAAVSPATGVMD